tara:strand:+ start:399 stop:770 length:372 start_codon:yes stop_codon:yes gene_type:complete
MTAEIITGPWKKNSTAEEIEAAKVLAECDRVVSDCTISVLQNLVESGIAPDDPSDESIRYILFLTELLKGATYHNYKIKHPFQEVVSLLCGTEYNNDEKHFYIDYSKVESIISFLKSQEKDPA